ncbi:hypothetical protein U1Q18_013390 [Sarracenia purpurea var. burkii]
MTEKVESRVDVSEVLQSGIVYLNKKRKFQAELLGLPLPKHKCWERSFSSEYDSPPNEIVRVEDFDVHLIKGKTVDGANDDESYLNSAKDSNSCGGDTDFATSVSGEAKIQSEYPKTHPSDRLSSSSVNWGSISSKNGAYSLDKDRSPNDFELYTCLDFDEHLIEFGSHMDYLCSEHGNDSMELNTDKELEDMLNLNETPPKNYVLSSGRWSVNQETELTTKKLTIDKEFEQYFSMLML